MPLCFALDFASVLIGAWLCTRLSQASKGGRAEILSAWLLMSLVWIAVAGVGLAFVGAFGQPGFLLCHSAALLVLGWYRRRGLTEDMRAFAGLWRRQPGEAGLDRWDLILGSVLVAGLLVLLGLAVLARPATLDAFSYHLPRSAHWLQEGRIGLIGAKDTRLDFVAVQSDVLVGWVLGASPSGYSLSVLPQAACGVLLIIATFGLARFSGLGRSGALLAAFLVLGMGNVAAQFSASQSDMLVAGTTAASVLLLVAALRRGGVSLTAAAGFGLGLGAKGTLFYLAPALLLWAVVFLRRHPVSLKAGLRFVLAGALAVLVFAGPSFLRNRAAYGDPFGPAVWVHKVHVPLPGPAEAVRKLVLNCFSSFVQDLEPGSQPPGFARLTRSLGRVLARVLPSSDPHSFEGKSRRQVLETVLDRTVTDVDSISLGVVPASLFGLGLLLAVWRRRQPGARLVLIWAMGALIFLLYYHLMQQWHPFGFRYFVLIAPWLAIPGAWWVEQAGGRCVPIIRLFVVLLCLSVTWRASVEPHQSGWRSVVAPERSEYSLYSLGWTRWVSELDRPEEGVRLLLPEERLLSAFYRQSPVRRVQYVDASGAGSGSAEECLRGQGGWLVVPARQFLGREGRVQCRTWLQDGGEQAPFSLAAYRLLQPGEQPATVLYRNRKEFSGGRQVMSVLARGGAGPLVLRARNPSGFPLVLELYWPDGHQVLALPSRAVLLQRIPLLPGEVSELRVTCSREDGLGMESPLAVCELEILPGEASR